MPEDVKPRTQHSPLRREQAAATRARIVGAAELVFGARGYEGARIEDIAAEAGVAYPTVYKAFGNKRNLLRAAVDSAMTGGAEGAVERQAWWLEQLEEPDAERQLRLIARNARRIYDRAGGVLEVVRAAAAGNEDIAALWQAINDERLDRGRTTAKKLSTKTRLRTTISETTRVLWALSGPELYILQTGHGGLKPEQYERWLGELYIAALLPT